MPAARPDDKHGGLAGNSVRLAAFGVGEFPGRLVDRGECHRCGGVGVHGHFVGDDIGVFGWSLSLLIAGGEHEQAGGSD